jgi:hypothetical protein
LLVIAGRDRTATVAGFAADVANWHGRATAAIRLAANRERRPTVH